jgi:hypothetical protein
MPIMLLFLWVAGCSSSEDRILSHLEEAYNEEFEIEHVDEGSWLFPEMYGRDKAIVHPKGNEELVFLSGEYRNNEGEYYDTYVLAKWGEELKASLNPLMEKELPGSPYKVYIRAEDGAYDPSMLDTPFQEYLELNKDISIVLIASIYTTKEPDVERYSRSIYNIYHKLKNYGTDSYVVSVGFVDESEDVSDYIRTTSVNNIAWTNLDAEIYGYIGFDERSNPDNPSPHISPEYIVNNPSDVETHYHEMIDKKE